MTPYHRCTLGSRVVLFYAVVHPGSPLVYLVYFNRGRWRQNDNPATGQHCILRGNFSSSVLVRYRTSTTVGSEMVNSVTYPAPHSNLSDMGHAPSSCAAHWPLLRSVFQAFLTCIVWKFLNRASFIFMSSTNASCAFVIFEIRG